MLVMKQLKTSALESSPKNCLTSLLPYDPNVKKGKRLKDGLKEYLLLLLAAEEAFLSLLRGNLEYLDPLVGENACQIRALRLALILLEEPLDTQTLLENIDRSKQIVKKNLASHQMLSSSEISLRDLIETNDLRVALSDNELYLIKSYLLSKVKTLRDSKPERPLVKNEYTDTKKIKEIAPVGTMFAENLVRKLREKTSSHSVKFVQKIASGFPASDPIAEMVSDKYLIKHRGLECLPCYWMTKVLMCEASNKSIPVVMLVEQIAEDRNHEVMGKTTLFFLPTEEGYKQVSPDSLDPEAPALVFLGRSCRNANEFPEKTSWENQLLESKDLRFQFHKEKSHEWGCSEENPSLFFLAHAYTDKIKNIRLSEVDS